MHGLQPRCLRHLHQDGLWLGTGRDHAECHDCTWTQCRPDAAAFAASALGVGAATRAQRDRKLEAEERTRREFGFVDVVTGDGGGDGRGGGGREGGDGGWGANDGDGASDGGWSRGFTLVRGGRNGFKWLALFLVCAWWCYFITNDPYMGTLWLACAIACGWGVFIIAGGVFVAGFVFNFFLQQYLANTMETDLEGGNDAGVLERLLNNQREAQMIKSGRYAKTIPEFIEERESKNSHLNPRMPHDVTVVGTDTQIAQIKLKPGEEVAASPGAILYSILSKFITN